MLDIVTTILRNLGEATVEWIIGFLAWALKLTLLLIELSIWIAVGLAIWIAFLYLITP